MNYNSKNIPALFILICFCFLSFYSCKKVTEKNEFEYYSGMMKEHTWFSNSNSGSPSNWSDSSISDIKIQHLGKRIGSKEDSIAVSFTDLHGSIFDKVLYFETSNSDSISYSGNSNSLIDGETTFLSKDKKSKKIFLHFHWSITLIGYDIYFSGDKK